MRHRYELAHVVRTHMGASDASYGCVFQQEDEEGTTGLPSPFTWLELGSTRNAHVPSFQVYLTQTLDV